MDLIAAMLILDNSIQMAKVVILAQTTPHDIILSYPVIPLELESKDDAKCFRESKKQKEGVFTSYTLYFLIAIGLSIKLNCNRWTTNVYCNNSNIIKLIGPSFRIRLCLCFSVVEGCVPKDLPLGIPVSALNE